MLAAKVTTPSARLGDARPLGAAASRFLTAAGVSYGLAGGVKAARAKSKLGKIEAATVSSIAGCQLEKVGVQAYHIIRSA
jgi:hypothetical protein